MIWCFDCDNTLCFTESTNYEEAKPNYEIINKINTLYNKGHTVNIFTGRGSESGLDWKHLTEYQLKEWGVKYHELIMGKPVFDVFVDNLAWNVKDFRDDNIPYTT